MFAEGDLTSKRSKGVEKRQSSPRLAAVGAVRLGMGSLTAKDRQALEVVGQTNERPLSGGSKPARQAELPKAQGCFDNANDWLDSAFAQTLDFRPPLRLKVVGHLDFGRLALGWGLVRLGEKGLPTLMLTLPTRGKVGFNSARLAGLKKPLSIAGALI